MTVPDENGEWLVPGFGQVVGPVAIRERFVVIFVNIPHIAVELRSRRLIIVRTLVLDVSPLNKITQSCRLHFDSGRLLCINCLF